MTPQRASGCPDVLPCSTAQTVQMEGYCSLMYRKQPITGSGCAQTTEDSGGPLGSSDAGKGSGTQVEGLG